MIVMDFFVNFCCMPGQFAKILDTKLFEMSSKFWWDSVFLFSESFQPKIIILF